MNISSAEFVRGIRGSDAMLSDGIKQIAFIGRSNVGKSSLLNALTANRGLAKTGKKPGKTTEINFFLINRSVYFADLPGYGYADATPSEREKLRKLIIWYFTSGEANPALTVLILEARAGLTRFDEEMIGVLKDRSLPFIIVLNKTDKLSQKEIAERTASIRAAAPDAALFLTSAAEGKGIEKLRDALI